MLLSAAARLPVVLGVALLAGLSPAAAQDAGGLTSAFSNIARPACHASGPRQPAEHETVTYRCRTSAGIEVAIAYLGTAVQVTFSTGDIAVRPQLGAGYDVGDRIEWRGRRTAKGFVPQAGILRLLSRNDDGKVVGVLAVVRVDRGAVCPAGWVDVAANPDANVVARTLADQVAAGFRCGRDKPVVAGPDTDLVKDIAARSPQSQ